MIYRDIPKFIIKRNMQKSAQTGIYFNYLVTDPIMRQICIEVTGRSDYEVEFVENDYCDEFLDAKYNQGRLGILQYHNTVTYISFSDEKCEGRNSGIQSVPTAFNRFYSNTHKDKRLYFYFLPCSGNNATPYYLFMYRLMRTAGFDFINTPSSLAGQINAFTTIDDIIRARKENGDKNSGNNATYILKNAPHEYEIFGKTYGANKYDTSLICYAISKLAQPEDHITLYEYNEKDLKELPAASLEVLHSMGNINIVNIDDEIERKELEENDTYVTLFSMPTIKPIDKDAILRSCTSEMPVFTIEEHSVIGGLGDAVGRVLLENKCNAMLRKFGVEDMFAPVTGTREYLDNLFGLSSQKIVENIVEELKKKKK